MALQVGHTIFMIYSGGTGTDTNETCHSFFWSVKRVRFSLRPKHRLPLVYELPPRGINGSKGWHEAARVSKPRLLIVHVKGLTNCLQGHLSLVNVESSRECPVAGHGRLGALISEVKGVGKGRVRQGIG